MRKAWYASVVPLFLLPAGAHAQLPSAGALFNQLSANYRALQSYRDTATWTRKTGGKEMTAAIDLAMERPNKYLLEVKGEKLGTVVVSDGTALTGYRVDRNAYTRTRAPQFLRGTDLLGGVDLPTPGARIISLLLQFGNQTISNPLAVRIRAGKVSDTLIDSKPAYLLTFRIDDLSDARIYVSDDHLIRRVSVLRDNALVIDERHENIEVDKPIPPSTFVKTIPSNARLVAELPKLEGLGSTETASTGPLAPTFNAPTADGRIVSLEALKGKVVLLNFFFND